MLEAESGERSLEILRSEPRIDFVLSDVGLPGMSGAELVSYLSRSLPTLPTLLISAWSKDMLVDKGWLRPNTDFLQKPFSGAELLSRVDTLLERVRAANAC